MTEASEQMLYNQVLHLQKISTQISLRILRSLSWAETVCFDQFCTCQRIVIPQDSIGHQTIWIFMDLLLCDGLLGITYHRDALSPLFSRVRLKLYRESEIELPFKYKTRKRWCITSMASQVSWFWNRAHYSGLYRFLESSNTKLSNLPNSSVIEYLIVS